MRRRHLNFIDSTDLAAEGRLFMKKSHAIHYDELPEKQVAGVLSENVLFLFINPTEYHGPHLPLANDYLISRGLADRLFVRLREQGITDKYVIAPLVNLGLDPTPGPGTIATSAAVFDYHLSQFVPKLAAHGAKRVVIMTFHGAPRHNHALQRFVTKLRAAGIAAVNPMNILLKRMFDYKPGDFSGALTHIKDTDEREKIERTLGRDYHAGFFESSLTLALAPDSVDTSYKDLPDCPAIEIPAWQKAAIRGMRSLGQTNAAREVTFAAEAMAWLNLQPFPGYTGAPRYANARSGEYFVSRILDEYMAVLEAVFVRGETGPEPVLGVTEMLSGLAGL